MKKIKGILLFGILTLLGISSSFARDYKSYGIRYYSNNNNQIQFNINGNTDSNFGGLTYFDNNSFNTVTGYLSIKGRYLELPSLSSFTFTGIGFYNPYVSTLKIYSDNINGLGLYYGANNSSSLNVLYLLSSLSDSFSNVPIQSSIPYFININASDSCIYTGVINNSGCLSINSYEIIGDSVTYSDLGVIHDSQIDGIDYNKGGISYSVGNTYSFWVITGDNSLIYPKTVYRTSTGYVSLNGYFISRVDNFNVINNNSDFDILALSVVNGTDDDYVWLYSVYTCPYNALDVSYCYYKDGGYLDESFSLTGGLFQFLSTGNFCSSSNSCNGNYFSLIYSSLSNSFTFSKVHSHSNSTNSLTYNQYSFNLLSDNSIDLLSGVVSPGGNGYQPENPYGMFGAKSLFYHCIVDHTTWDNPYCYNPDGTLKSDDELKSCYYSTYIDMSDGGSEEFVEYYCIDDHGLIQNVAIELDGSGAVFVPCEDSSCQFTTSFGSLTGYSVDFFDNYLNKTGYFFKCPWPYDNKLTIWPKLITLLNGVDVLLPINCAFAGFSNGKTSINFENSGHFIQNGPLLIFEGDNRTLLYRFFDIFISLGIVIFVGKIFYLFHK